MTTDLEKRFFDTFGIEPKYEDACRLADEYWNNEHLANAYGVFDNYMEAMGCPINKDGCTDECRHAYCKTIYPQITDHILLKLICIANKYGVLPYTTTIKNLKDRTLRILIKVQKYREKYLPESNSTIKLPKTIRKTFKE